MDLQKQLRLCERIERARDLIVGVCEDLVRDQPHGLGRDLAGRISDELEKLFNLELGVLQSMRSVEEEAWVDSSCGCLRSPDVRGTLCPKHGSESWYTRSWPLL